MTHNVRRALGRASARLNRAIIGGLGPTNKLVGRLAQVDMTPDWLSVRPVADETLTGEWLTLPGAPARGTLLYVHGGGWVMGYYPLNRRFAGYLARAGHCTAFALAYRLAPAHPFPAALDDCVAAYQWLLSQGIGPERLVLVGDSAGGNLVLALLLRLRDARVSLPAGAICFSPVTDLTDDGMAQWGRDDAGLSAGLLRPMIRHYRGGHDPGEPLLSPARGDLAGLPPLLIQVGAEELLRGDAAGLAERARAAGVPAELQIWPGMWHAWHYQAPFLPEATAAINAAGQFIRSRLAAAAGGASHSPATTKPSGAKSRPSQ